MLDRIFERVASARPSRVVLTKVDEAVSLAGVVSWIRDRGVSISYLGTGQRVPDDLEIATPASLAAWMTGGDTSRGAAA